MSGKRATTADRAWRLLRGFVAVALVACGGPQAMQRDPTFSENQACDGFHFQTGPMDRPAWMEGPESCLDDELVCAYGVVKLEGNLCNHPDVAMDIAGVNARIELIKYVHSRVRTSLRYKSDALGKGHCKEVIEKLAVVSNSDDDYAHKQSQIAKRATSTCPNIDPITKSLIKLLYEETKLNLTGLYRGGIWEHRSGANVHNLFVLYKVKIEDLRLAIALVSGDLKSARQIVKVMLSKPEA